LLMTRAHAKVVVYLITVISQASTRGEVNDAKQNRFTFNNEV